MGGQNAAVVLAYADVEAAAGMIASAAMGYAGQKCTATGGVIRDQPVLSDMRDALADAIGRMVVEGPDDPGCQVGPLITPAARERALDAIARAKDAGGRIVTGGDDLGDTGTDRQL